MDQDVPSTFEDKQQGYSMLSLAAIQGNTLAQSLINDPNNASVLIKLIGVPGLHSSNANATDKQMGEIEELVNSKPVLNQQAVQQFKASVIIAQASGQPPPQPDPYLLFVSSIQTGKFDDDAGELVACKNWINSPAGQRIKSDNPEAFFNVELHAIEHQAKAQAQQAQQAQMAMSGQMALEASKHPPKQPKSPTESINFKDLGPSGKLQLAQQAGLDIKADVAADTVEDSMMPPQPRKLKRE
jgi:hypothetical protein